MINRSVGDVVKRVGVRADGVAIRGDRKPVKPRYTHGVVCFRPVTRVATRAAWYIEALDDCVAAAKLKTANDWVIS